MVIGGSKKEVIRNIREAILRGDFNAKVEIGDPDISLEEQLAAVRRFYKIRENATSFKVKSLPARKSVTSTLRKLGDAVRFEGLERLPELEIGAIVTSNHFNPLDSLAVREALKAKYGRDACIVAQATNLCQPDPLGYLFNHIDVLPLVKSAHYIKGEFETRLKERISAGDLVLIYPEEEMWFNYRKPRPVKRGAYQFAAVAGAPVISFFTEIGVRREGDENRGGSPAVGILGRHNSMGDGFGDVDELGEPLVDNDEFYQVNYIAHALGVIYPDSGLSVRENAIRMAEEDYKMKCRCFEEVFGEELDYEFSERDIVGWRG